MSIIADKHYPIDLGMLPSSWSASSMRDLVREVQTGFSSSKHNELGEGIPHLRPMNVSRLGRVVLNQVKYIPSDSSGSQRLQAGDILFNNTNSAELVGKSALFTLEGEWAFSNHMTALRVSSQIRPAFLSFQLYYLWLIGYFKARRKQHIGQASISLKTLLDTIPIVVPPIIEQKPIEEEITATLADLENVQQVLAVCKDLLRKYQIGSLGAAVRGLLISHEDGAEISQGPRFTLLPPFSDDTLKDVPFAIPDSWRWVRIGDVGEIQLGRQRAPKHHSGEHMRPYLRVANVYEDDLNLSDVQKMNFTPAEFKIFELQPGDILLNEGQSPELVGRPAMYRGEIPGACFQNTLLRFRAHEGVSASFALLVFRAYLHSGRFKRAAKWSTNLAHLGRNRFAEIEFPLPPLLEQERVVAECAERFASVSSLSETINILEEQIAVLRSSFLGAAFKGLFTFPESPGSESADESSEKVHQQSSSTKRVRTPRRDMSKKSSRHADSILEILRRVGHPISPEELFAERGLGEDLVDIFFAELKELSGRSVIGQREGPNGTLMFLHDGVLS